VKASVVVENCVATAFYHTEAFLCPVFRELSGLGPDWQGALANLIAIGLFEVTTRQGAPAYTIPFLYRAGLDVTQGRA